MVRRVIVVMAAVLLAAIGTFAIITYVHRAEDRALAGEEVVEVVVVSDPIEAGTSAGEITEATSIEQVPRKVAAAGSISDVGELEADTVASTDLVPGEQVVAGRFVEPAVLVEEQLDVPEGLQVVTIPLAPHRAVGGQIGPGDLVGILGSIGGAGVPDEADPEEVEAAGDATHLLLQKVDVINVQGEATPSRNEAEGEGSRSRAAQAPGDLHVTLAVDAAQAEQVVFLAEHGQLWLTKQTEDTNEDGTRIQRRETIFE